MHTQPCRLIHLDMTTPQTSVPNTRTSAPLFECLVLQLPVTYNLRSTLDTHFPVWFLKQIKCAFEDVPRVEIGCVLISLCMHENPDFP